MNLSKRRLSELLCAVYADGVEDGRKNPEKDWDSLIEEFKAKVQTVAQVEENLSVKSEDFIKVSDSDYQSILDNSNHLTFLTSSGLKDWEKYNALTNEYHAIMSGKVRV